MGVIARDPWFRLNAPKYWALAFIIRRALSSESGFLGRFDLGFGLLTFLLLPSLSVHGSGVTEQETMVCFGLGLLVGLCDGDFNGVEQRNEDCRASID